MLVEQKFNSYSTLLCLEKPICDKYLMEEQIDKDLSFGYNSPYKFARYDCILI